MLSQPNKVYLFKFTFVGPNRPGTLALLAYNTNDAWEAAKAILKVRPLDDTTLAMVQTTLVSFDNNFICHFDPGKDFHSGQID